MSSIDEYADEVKKWRDFQRRRPEKIVIPGTGQESVWDYPLPPRIELVSQRLRVEFGGVVLAETEQAYRVLETATPPTYYFPPDDVRTDYLQPSQHQTLCEWKGMARYWTVRVGDRVAQNACWSYPEPFEGYEAIADYVAFYPQKMDACYVGEQRVTAQPGTYYGGWVTPNIVGPFKGEPGTEDW
jgi:uncharacterized protein (DUF427 family)